MKKKTKKQKGNKIKKQLKLSASILCAILLTALIGTAGFTVFKFGLSKSLVNTLVLSYKSYLTLIIILSCWKIYQNKLEGLITSMLLTISLFSALVIGSHFFNIEPNMTCLLIGITAAFFCDNWKLALWVEAFLLVSGVFIWLSTGDINMATGLTATVMVLVITAPISNQANSCLK